MAGRPREFDRDRALQAAMRLFWSKGYDQTSISDLTEELGINRPSLYGAFGSKDQLFAEALRHYDETEGKLLAEILETAPTAKCAIENYLVHNAKAYVRAGQPRGCMSVVSGPLGSGASPQIRRLLANSRDTGRLALLARLQKASTQGELGPEVSVERLAAFYAAINASLSLRASDAAGEQELLAIVDSAMSAWSAVARQ